MRGLNPDTGKRDRMFFGRSGCARSTASMDSILMRGREGTARFDVKTNKELHISPVRPACDDGVMIANGMGYWGPWMCGCNMSLFGNVAMTSRPVIFLTGNGESKQYPAHDTIAPSTAKPGDWTAFRGVTLALCGPVRIFLFHESSDGAAVSEKHDSPPPWFAIMWFIMEPIPDLCWPSRATTVP